jgi:MCP family monocarboxylic acid transporter-like MFS transporter 10
MSSVLVLCGLTYRPLLPPPPRPAHLPGQSRVRGLAERLIYLPNWRNKRYVIWALAVPCALFGYFVPYVHLVRYFILGYSHFYQILFGSLTCSKALQFFH